MIIAIIEVPQDDHTPAIRYLDTELLDRNDPNQLAYLIIVQAKGLATVSHALSYTYGDMADCPAFVKLPQTVETDVTLFIEN